MRFKLFLEKFDGNSEKALIDVATEYKDRTDIFVHLSDLEKIGIYPMSDFNTPVGVYTYPIKFVYETLTAGDDLPFADDRFHFHVLKANSNIKVWNLDDRYNSKHFDTDLEKLIKFNQENGSDATKEELQRIIEDSSTKAIKKSPSGIMWYILKESATMFNKHKSGAQNKRVYSNTPTLLWNYLIRVVLGYDLVNDTKGYGIIHPSEPLQAFFTSSRGYERIILGDHSASSIPERIGNALKNGKYDTIPDDYKTDEQLVRVVKQVNPYYIKYIENPSDAVIKAAVSVNPKVIKYVIEPTEEVQIIAVKQDPAVIDIIDGPTERVLKLAGK